VAVREGRSKAIVGVVAAGLLCCAWCAVSCASGPAASCSPPNILIVLADDMGFSDAGCYGGEIATPHLDALAASGLRFTQFYNTARCWPTRSSILTGYYAQQIRMDPPRGRLPPWTRLLPHYLKPLGYRCYHSGKWHVTGAPKPVADGGFDRSYWFEDWDRYFSPAAHFEDDRLAPPVKPDSGYYATTAFADHAIRCLKDHARDHPGEPFFSYLAFISPHFPLHALPEDIARYRDRYLEGWDAVRERRWQRLRQTGIVHCGLSLLDTKLTPRYFKPELLETVGPGEIEHAVAWSALTDRQRQFQAGKMAVHAAMVDRMDREIGRVLEQLKKMGAFDDTLVMFASDNGASAEIMVRGDGHDPQAAPGSADTFLCLGPGWSSSSNTPLRRHKTWVHEGGIATPLIAHWPKGITARGELRHSPSHLIDIVPTVLELTGLEHPETIAGKPAPPLPGKSLVPEFAKDGAVTREYLWWSHEGNRAIRMGDWKLVAAGGPQGPWELYDLSRDRGEIEDLASTHPDKVRELQQAWEQHLAEFREQALRDLPAKAAPAKGAKKAAERKKAKAKLVE